MTVEEAGDIGFWISSLSGQLSMDGTVEKEHLQIQTIWEQFQKDYFFILFYEIYFR